jgi:hypothetical protein
LLIALPLVLAVIATAIAWRHIGRPVLYFFTSCLCLLGLQGLAAPAAVGVFLPSGGGLTLAAAHEAFSRSVIVGAIIVFAVGSPFLWWLSRAFHRLSQETRA